MCCRLKNTWPNRNCTAARPRNNSRFPRRTCSRKTRLTPGGIKNGYINIKPLDDFWPEECRGGNVDRALQHLIVEFEGVRRVTTDISGRHKTLRSAHREVKKFVAAHGLRPGDVVEIVRIGKYEYRIRPTAR